MRKFLISVLFSILLFGISCTSVDDKPELLNFVFILADDLGAHDLSYTGSAYYETPHIDQIARSGAVFRKGYAASRVCSPSRASIMTGRFTARHGITDWIGARTGADWRLAKRHDRLLPASNVEQLPANELTIAESLKSAGYKTFFAGKWHLGGEGSLPTDHGFDINVGGWDKGSPIGGYFSPWTNPFLSNRKSGENLSMRLAEETADFISEHRNEPFFAFLSFYAVHGPIQTSSKKWKKYRDKASRTIIEKHGFEMEEVLPIRLYQDNPVYAGLVEQMDDAVGVVLNQLKSLGLDKNTVVIFTSDNGGVASGDSYSTSNSPLRGGKGYQWEGGVREPFFIKVPGLTDSGIEVDVPVTGTDFYPTIVDLAGLELSPDQHKDGVSLLPLMDGGKLEKRALYWHYPHYGNQGGKPSSIILRDDWKLIYFHETKASELYNLATDKGENTNLSLANSDRAAQLEKELLDWLSMVNAQFPEEDPSYDAAAQEEYLNNIIEVKLPDLEKRRRAYLDSSFVGPDNWWGSFDNE